MRKLFVALVVCISTTAPAQKSFFGVIAGVSVANQRAICPFPAVRGSIIFAYNVVKPTFGAYYEYQFLNKFAARLSAQYLALGYRGNILFVTNDLDINYITLPLSLGYLLTDHFRFKGGPYVSFTIDGSKILNKEITNYYHKNDFGFILGAEHDIYKNFSLGVNYILGTKNIWLADQGGSYKVANRALQLTLIYKFKKPS